MKHVVLSAIALALLSSAALAAAEYPDKHITPGLARADATVEQLCGTNWATADKPVSASVRRDIVTAYRLSGHDEQSCRSGNAKKCKIDHLIARKLGGADVAVNLWPQRTAGEWSAPAKDKLEDCMHTRVCAKLAEQGPEAATRLLHIYQHDLVADWVAAFKNVIGDATETCSRS